MWVADDWGYLRLDSEGDESFAVDELGFIRLDARAGMTICTPGRTVPCGNVCRTPANCKKKKGESSQDRLKRFSKDDLAKIANEKRKAKGLGDRETVNTVKALENEIFPAVAQRTKPQTTPPVVTTAKRSRNAKPKTTEQPTKEQKTKPIRQYKDFQSEVSSAYQRINRDFNHDDLVPIHKLRRELGDRVPSGKFDEWMMQMQADDMFTLSGDDDKNATPDQLKDCVKTKLGKRRCFATSIKPAETASQKTTKPTKESRQEETKETKKSNISYDTFKSETSKVFDQIDKDGGHDGLVPIYKIRRAIGDKVSRKQFNDMMLQLQNDDEFSYVEGTVEDSAPDKIADCITTKLGKLRCYAQRSRR